jgi:uncharacterized secreted protein with C-terminal beta-propeller domain
VAPQPVVPPVVTASPTAPRVVTTRPRPRPVAAALTGFGSCRRLTSALRREALTQVTAYGLGGALPVPGTVTGGAAAGGSTGGGPVPAPASAPGTGVPSFSGTTVQEDDVDEPDVVKTDGRLLVFAAGWPSQLRVVDVSGSRPVHRASFPLHLDSPRLLLSGSTVLALSTEWRPEGLVTVVEVVDISRPSSPTWVRSFRLTGELLDARMLHGRVVVAVRSQPDLPLVHPTTGGPAAVASALRTNRRVVSRATTAQLLPAVTVKPGGASFRASCQTAYHPGVPSGLQRTSLVTLDPERAEPTQNVTVVGSSSHLYASASALYIATSRWRPQVSGRTAGSVTDLHGFDVATPDQLRFLGSGSVPGGLTDHYALSEHDGDLRVATTVEAQSPRALSDSRVTVLRPDREVLVQVGQVRGLGRGERIYGVRFVGKTGYVVTFRQTDPLYVIDLSRPTRPRLRGELKVTGYSSTLLPLQDGQLLGIGQDVDAQLRQRGTQVSVFDVSRPTRPLLRSKVVLPAHYSPAEHDHHALLWWPKTRFLVLPADASSPEFHGAVVLRVGTSGTLKELSRVRAPGSAPLERSVVVGRLLYSLAQTGIVTTPLERLDQHSWLPFP